VHVLQKPRRDGAGVTGVGVEGLDDLFDGDGGVADAPGVVVGGSADEGVAGGSATRSRRGRAARTRNTRGYGYDVDVLNVG
jgi:hypothetical protein